ncbi:MAG: type II secretion system GspH family protein [bacterium]|nr:type II secretion system GspH family protein [bacterium]
MNTETQTGSLLRNPQWSWRLCCGNNRKNIFSLRLDFITDRGFILLEVLVSILILSIGLVAVLGAFSSSTKIIATSKRYAEAIRLAEQKMFELQTMPIDSWRTRDSGEFGDQYPEYSWEYEVEECDSEFPELDSEISLEPEKYYRITLRIKYEEQGKSIVPIELVTYITNPQSFLE